MSLTFGFPSPARWPRAAFAGPGGLGEADPPDVLARSGALEVRLARSKAELRAAQRLRYRVFFEEGGALPRPSERLLRRDLCRFDAVSDHLLVVDRASLLRRGAPAVVGVYRLLRQDVAAARFGFASAAEFDVASLLASRPTMRFLELGRACVAPSHRGKRALDLLWRGLWRYARAHRVDALFGCASLPGADPAAHTEAIALLAGDGREVWQVRARPERRAALPYEAAAGRDRRAIARALPPLVKGYWRLGATFSAEAVVDARFGVTDLCVVMPLAAIEARYLEYFGVAGDAPGEAA